MTGAILIYGGTATNRLNEANKIIVNSLKLKLETNPNLLTLEKDGKSSIGIKQAKEGIKFIGQKPFGKYEKCVVCYNSELLTTQAQNALLKTLEELPKYASIILCVKSLNDLLPTVISRCQKIAVKADEKETYLTEQVLPLLDRGTLIDWALEESKEEREVVIENLEKQISITRKYMLQQPSKKISNSIKTLNQVVKDLKTTNINLKLALEYLATNV